MKTKHKSRKVKDKKGKKPMTHKKRKSPKGGVKKDLAATYIALCNQAIQCMFQDESKEVFTEEFNILWTSGFIETGAKRGFRLIKNDQYQLDPNCNVVCLSNALIMYGIVDEGEYHKLSHLQKLYLFFVDYLNRDGNDKMKEELPFEYAVRKVDKKLQTAKAYHKKKVDEKAKAKSIKTALKSINKIETERGEIESRYESWHKTLAKHKRDWAYWEAMGEANERGVKGIRPPDVPHKLRVKVCGNTDCAYITENDPGLIKAQDDTDISKVVSIFCENMLYVFKGIIWLLMEEFSEGEIYMYSNGVDPEPSTDSNKLQINLPIHSLVENTNSVLIPSAIIYSEPLSYDVLGLASSDDAPWIYTDMKKDSYTGEYTMDKRLVDDLRDDTMYLTANLNPKLDADEMEQFIEEEEEFEPPVLEYLQRTFETLGDGSKVPQLREHISNSISQHWYVSPLRSISDNVQIQRADEFLGAKKKQKKKKKKKKPKKKTTRR